MATAAQARELLNSLKEQEVTIAQAVQDLKQAGEAPKDSSEAKTASAESAPKRD